MSNDYRNFFEEQRKYYDNLDAQKKAVKNDKQQPSEQQKTAESPKKMLDGKEFMESNEYKQSSQTFKDLADYYNKNGEDKLVSDIFTSVKAQKTNGSLTNEQILQFSKSLMPMLNAQQKEKLSELVNRLLDT